MKKRAFVQDSIRIHDILAKLMVGYNNPLRCLDGIARIYFRGTGIRSVCYTNIFRWRREIVPHLPHTSGKPVNCTIDPTGFKITIRGIYL